MFRSFYSKTGAYAQSKAAQIMFTKTLDDRLATAEKPVHVYAIHPGFIYSNLYQQTWYAKFITLTTGFMFKVILKNVVFKYNNVTQISCKLLKFLPKRAKLKEVNAKSTAPYRPRWKTSMANISLTAK